MSYPNNTLLIAKFILSSLISLMEVRHISNDMIKNNASNDDVFCNGGISNAHKSNRKQWSTHLWQMIDTALKGG